MKNSCGIREARAYNAITAARKMGHSRDSSTVRKLVKRWERIVVTCRAKGLLR